MFLDPPIHSQGEVVQSLIEFPEQSDPVSEDGCSHSSASLSLVLAVASVMLSGVEEGTPAGEKAG